MNDLNGKVAVITGGASGIGLAMARAFAARGMKLVLADIDRAALDTAVAGIAAGGVDAIGVRVDVRDEAQVRALADAAWDRHGAVHVICNNAGVAAPVMRAAAWESSIDDWRWMLDVNFMGVLHGVRAFVPRMLAGGEAGHVVNTASVAGLLTGANPYSVSKHAVTCLTEGVYKDLKALGAKVSASVLCPGIVRTAIFEGERNRAAEYGPATGDSVLGPQARAWTAKFRDALANGLEPEVVANAVVDGILNDRFYLLPAQPLLLEAIRTRMSEVSEQRNPSPPPQL
jgi:NAD(P)-dependent dehydrogenase (short-subunit alcohol dehydrogenase family)